MPDISRGEGLNPLKNPPLRSLQVYIYICFRTNYIDIVTIYIFILSLEKLKKNIYVNIIRTIFRTNARIIVFNRRTEKKKNVLI